MQCPICHHAETKVIRTADREDDTVRRMRRCTQCGHSFPTREVAETEVDRAGAIVEKARELVDLVGRV